MDIDDMNAKLGKHNARGEFETRFIDGERVEREIRLRSYGLLVAEYRYPDGRPSRWGVLLPHFAEEVLMNIEQVRTMRDALDHILDPRFPLGRPTQKTDAATSTPAPMWTRWFSRPECEALTLRTPPQLECWNKADDPAQRRLQDYLDDTQSLLAPALIHDGPWALRLDVGLPASRDLLDMADLDNYLFPLAKRLSGASRGNTGLVSAWCTKQHSTQSFVRIEPAREANAPTTPVLHLRSAPPADTYKEQVRAAVAGAAELPPGPVKLELSFVVGPGRNWLNLWKPTIDALDPILGRTNPNRDWHPLDGRITELGLHLTVDPAARHDVAIGVAATPA